MSIRKLIERKPLSGRYQQCGWYNEAEAEEIVSIQEDYGRTQKKLVASKYNQLIMQKFYDRPVSTLEGIQHPEYHILVSHWDAAEFLSENQLNTSDLNIPAPHLMGIDEALGKMKE